MHMRERELIPLVEQHVKPYFSAQVAVALACADLGLRTMALPARFNYPNRPETEALQPGELAQVVAFHYLYQANFKRSTLFSERECYEDFLRKDLEGPDRVFQLFIRQVNGQSYPFE